MRTVGRPVGLLRLLVLVSAARCEGCLALYEWRTRGPPRTFAPRLPIFLTREAPGDVKPEQTPKATRLEPKGQQVMPTPEGQHQVPPQAAAGSRTVPPPSVPDPQSPPINRQRQQKQQVRSALACHPARLRLIPTTPAGAHPLRCPGRSLVRRVVYSGHTEEDVAPCLTSGLVLLAEDPRSGFSPRSPTGPGLRSSGDRAPLS